MRHTLNLFAFVLIFIYFISHTHTHTHTIEPSLTSLTGNGTLMILWRQPFNMLMQEEYILEIVSILRYTTGLSIVVYFTSFTESLKHDNGLEYS